MKKYAYLFLAAAVLAWAFSFDFTLAKSGNANNANGQLPPEVDGTYDVPGHPGMKVRVFVHQPNPGKGGRGGQGKTDPTPQDATCSDPSVNAVVGLTGWKLPNEVTYNLNTSSAPTYVGNLANIADAAFSQWTGAIGGKITLTQGADTYTAKAGRDGQNIIAWGRTSGTALAVTYTWYNTSTGYAVETDTIMNQKFFWASGCYANAYDAQDILTHELGHWFGLNDEYTSGYVDNTMFGYGDKAEIKKDTLTAGDKLGIQAIYN